MRSNTMIQKGEEIQVRIASIMVKALSLQIGNRKQQHMVILHNALPRRNLFGIIEKANMQQVHSMTKGPKNITMHGMRRIVRQIYESTLVLYVFS